MKVAINGFGRIGRAAFKLAIENGIDIVAINDVHGVKQAAYLLQHDSVYGRYGRDVLISSDTITVAKNKVKVLSERDPMKLPWKEMEVDIVIESTGAFRNPRDARMHLKAGAKYVLITAPCKQGKPDITVVPGVNENKLLKKHKIISVASCTTNCLAPLVKVLHDNFVIKRGLITTVHAYTNDQDLHDSPKEGKVRRGRAAALNIIPTTTGAAQSVTEVIPDLLGKINGLAVRVPVSDGSLVDFVAELKKGFTVKQVNNAFKKIANGKMAGILEYSEEELVSSDVIGNLHSSVVDGLSTMKDGNLVKVLAWYDNELGYSMRLIDVIRMIEELNSGKE